MVNSGGPPAPPPPPPSPDVAADAGDRPAALAAAPASARAPPAHPVADMAAAAVCCSVPLDKVQAVLGASRKLLCLYCDRSFASLSLRQKHVERGHGARRGRRRRQPAAASAADGAACLHCDQIGAEHTLAELFRHLTTAHPTKYFGCLRCEERFLSAATLAEHNATAHTQPSVFVYPTVVLPKIEEVVVDALPVDDTKLTRSKLKTKVEDPLGGLDERQPSPVPPLPPLPPPAPPAKGVSKKKIIVKSSKLTLKRSKRLEAQAKEKESQRKVKKRSKPPEKKGAATAGGKSENSTKTTDKSKSCVNPYPEFDSFYRVKKITDHSIDNLKISSLTFDDVFDKAFFNRIKCNIEENLSQHIDGKLFKNEESESRISNFEKVSGNHQEVPNSNPESFGCEVSLNAVTPITSISLNAQIGEDFESQIEYGAKANKKKTQIKKDEIHYKYFTRRKYQASILEHKENRDLSRLDMWTQLVIKERQQKMLDDKKSAKELLEYTTCEEYKNKIKREELNRILDRRGPFEDLKEEATKKAAFEKLNSSPEVSVNEETFLGVREVLNELLNKVCESCECREATSPEAVETTPVRSGEERQIPAYLNLRRASSLPSDGEMDRSDKITLICSSQETENFELPTNTTRAKNEIIELTGEWARCRMYVCAACGAKLPNMRYLLDHKSVYHQNVWAQHYEFVGNQSELYRHLSIPGLGKVGAVEESVQCKAWRRSDARACTKCAKQCNSLGELHRHILECGGDWTWMLARKKCKYRPFGAKSRRKRRGKILGLVNRVHHKQKTVNSEKKTYKKPFEGPRQRPSDADTIQRMLANLPAKRRRRTIISLQDAIYKSRKNKSNNNIQANRAASQNNENTNNGRKAVRNLNKVLSSRILDTNSTLIVKRKLKNIRNPKNMQPDHISGENKEEKILDILKIPQIQIRPFNLKNQKTKTTTKINDESAESAESKKRASPRSSTNVSKNKMSVKKILSSKLNIKNFFPVKKKKNKDIPANTGIPDESNITDKPTRSKVIDNVTNEKKVGLKGLVRSLSNRKKKEADVNTDLKDESSMQENKKNSKTPKKKPKKTNQDKEPNNPEQSKLSKKRKLQNSFRTVIDKVKKLKIDNSQYKLEENLNGAKIDLKNQTNIFLEKEKQEKERLNTIVSLARITATHDKSLPVHTVNNFSDTKENPPIPETIFNLETSNEKSLQAKGELDFDKRQDITISSKFGMSPNNPLPPISIETSPDKPKPSPMVSPNLKGKLRKPNRGLNDCIAMLTSKLQQKDQESSSLRDRSLDSLFSPSCSKAQQKNDYILRVPTFRVTSQPQTEETALDLSKKTPTVSKSASNPDLSVNNLSATFPLINNVVNSTINTVIGNVIENKCKEVLTEKLCPKWSSVDSLARNPALNNSYIRKSNSVDDIIEFVVKNYQPRNLDQTDGVAQSFLKKTVKKASGSSRKSSGRKASLDAIEKLNELALILPVTLNPFVLDGKQFKKVDSAIKGSVPSKKSSSRKFSTDTVDSSLPERLVNEQALKSVVNTRKLSSSKKSGKKKTPTEVTEPVLDLPETLPVTQIEENGKIVEVLKSGLKISSKKKLSTDINEETYTPSWNLLETLNTPEEFNKDIENDNTKKISKAKKSARKKLSTETGGIKNGLNSNLPDILQKIDGESIAECTESDKNNSQTGNKTSIENKETNSGLPLHFPETLKMKNKTSISKSLEISSSNKLTVKANEQGTESLSESPETTESQEQIEAVLKNDEIALDKVDSLESNESPAETPQDFNKTEEHKNEEIRNKEENSDVTKDGDSLENLNDAFIQPEPALFSVNISVKSKRVLRKVGQPRNKSRKMKTIPDIPISKITQLATLNAETSETPAKTTLPLETNLDYVLNVQEVPVNESMKLTTTVISAINNIDDRLLNEDEPILLENKIMELNEKNKFSDSEDELPLASLIKTNALSFNKLSSDSNKSVEVMPEKNVRRNKNQQKQDTEMDVSLGLLQNENEREQFQLTEQIENLANHEEDLNISVALEKSTQKSSENQQDNKLDIATTLLQKECDISEVQVCKESSIVMPGKEQEITNMSISSRNPRKENKNNKKKKGTKAYSASILSQNENVKLENVLTIENVATTNCKQTITDTEICSESLSESDKKDDIKNIEPVVNQCDQENTVTLSTEENLSAVAVIAVTEISVSSNISKKKLKTKKNNNIKIDVPIVQQKNSEKNKCLITENNTENKLSNIPNNVGLTGKLEYSNNAALVLDVAEILESNKEIEAANSQQIEGSHTSVISKNDLQEQESDLSQILDHLEEPLDISLHSIEVQPTSASVGDIDINEDEQFPEKNEKITEILNQISQEIQYIENEDQGISEYEDQINLGIKIKKNKKGSKRTSKEKNKSKGDKKRKRLLEQTEKNDVSTEKDISESFVGPMVPDIAEKVDLVQVPVSLTNEAIQQTNDSLELTNNTESPNNDISVEKRMDEQITNKQQTEIKNSYSKNISDSSVVNGTSRERKSRAAKEKARNLIARTEKLAESPQKTSENDIEIADVSSGLIIKSTEPEKCEHSSIEDLVAILTSDGIEPSEQLDKSENDSILEKVEKVCDELKQIENELIEMTSQNGSAGSILFEPEIPNDSAVKTIATENEKPKYLDRVLSVEDNAKKLTIAEQKDILAYDLNLTNAPIDENTRDSITSQECIPFNLNDKSHPFYEQLYNTAVLLDKLDTELTINIGQFGETVRPIRSRSPKKSKKAGRSRAKTKSKSPMKKRASYPTNLAGIYKTNEEVSTRRLTRSRSLNALTDSKNKEGKKAYSPIIIETTVSKTLFGKECQQKILPKENGELITQVLTYDTSDKMCKTLVEVPTINKVFKTSKKKPKKILYSPNVPKNDNTLNSKTEVDLKNDENIEIPILEPFSVCPEKSVEDSDNLPPVLTIENVAINKPNLMDGFMPIISKTRKMKKAKKRKRASDEHIPKLTMAEDRNFGTNVRNDVGTFDQQIENVSLTLSEDKTESEQAENKSPTEEQPIKIIINKHRTRRKSKSFRKIEKTDNDLFEDFALVINKKTKRIPPTNIVDDSVCEAIDNLFSLPTENNKISKLDIDNKCLDDSVEEMDMEIDIPVNSSIIERNADESVTDVISELKQEETNAGLEGKIEEMIQTSQSSLNDETKLEAAMEVPISESQELSSLNDKTKLEAAMEVPISEPQELPSDDLVPVDNMLNNKFVETPNILGEEISKLSFDASNKVTSSEQSDFSLITSIDTSFPKADIVLQTEKTDLFNGIAEGAETENVPVDEIDDTYFQLKSTKPEHNLLKKNSSKQKRKLKILKSKISTSKQTESPVGISDIIIPDITKKTGKLNGSLEELNETDKCESFPDDHSINLVKEIVEIADKININEELNDQACESQNEIKDPEISASTSESQKIPTDISVNLKQFVSDSLTSNKSVFERELEPSSSIEGSIGSMLESIVKGKGRRKANILPDIEPLTQILSSSDMDIAPVIDEIDKSLEIDDIYDFNEEVSYETLKKKKEKKSGKNNKIGLKPFEKVFENNSNKTLDDLNENIEMLNSSTELVDTFNSECPRKKCTRTAKAKALENIHEEALAELTENDQNRVCDVNTELEAGTKKKVPKKSKKKNQQLINIESEIINADAEIPILSDTIIPPSDKPEQTKENVIPQESEPNKNETNNEIYQESCELRRSRRGSRKVASYNENDLIDPLIDALENKRKSMKKDRQLEKPTNAAKEPEKKLNSEELFDLLKASTENEVFVAKTTTTQQTFISNLEESNSTRDFNDDNFENVFENMLEKSSILIQSSLLDKKNDEDKIYEFTESSPENSEIQKEPDYKLDNKSKTGKTSSEDNIASNTESTCDSSIDNTMSLPHTPDLKYSMADTKSKGGESERTNYCEICNKCFSRVENLIKHKRTLTHISKLSELEAKEAEEKAAKLQKENEVLEPEVLPELEVSETSLKTSDSLREEINITDILQKSEQPACDAIQTVQPTTFANNQTLKLADIINDVLNKPVLNDLESDKVNNFSDIIMQNNSSSESEFRRYKSLGERKSFDSEKLVNNTPTTFAEKQISLLENIIEKQSGNLTHYIDDISSSSHDSRVSNEQEESSNLFTNSTKANTTEDTFLKPTQYEEISEDSTNVKHYEDAKMRKTLNRDEELFIECCSLLKSGSEVSNYSKKSGKLKVPDGAVRSCENEPECMENKELVQTPACEDAHEFSDNSRTPTPLGDTFDDNASDSNTISSNWNTKDGPEALLNTQSFTFEEVLHGEKTEGVETADQMPKFIMISNMVKNQIDPMSNILSRKHEESTESTDSHLADGKKIITKGARKVFEGLKVSIPTEELNLEEVLNCSPKTKSDGSKSSGESSSPSQELEKPIKSSRKSKPVKKAQVGGNILFKINKKKSNSKSDGNNQQQQKDVYDFEETQDNIEVFVKPNYRAFRSQKSESDTPNGQKEMKVPEDEIVEATCDDINGLSKEETPPENITKKKCKIMGRIFKSQAKNKVDEVDEEIRAIPEIDNNELVENYVLNCTHISQTTANNFESDKKPKLTEKELDKLFDELLENTQREKDTNTKPSPKSKLEKPEPKTVDKKKQPKLKNRKRTRANSESSDDEFNINKSTKKRTNRKNAKEEDNCINLEQELRECIGVASRKSQRKCTSGKQNVLVEYWSSDEEAFEALLESQKIQSKQEDADDAPSEPVIENVHPPEKIEKAEKPARPKATEKKLVRKKPPPAEKKPTGEPAKPADNASVTANRRKRAAVNPLYHWSSSSEDESQNLIEVKPIREELDDDEDRPIQHGWIVGDSPKKLVTMLALTKGKKTDIDCVKEQKKRTSAGS